MLIIRHPEIPIEAQGKINRMAAELATERQRNDDAEAALVELADLFAAQDDAIVELAELIEEG